MKKSFILILFTCYSFFSIAQADTLFTIPSEYIIPIEDAKNELIEELRILELKEKIIKKNFIVIGETHGVKESTAFIKQIANTKKIDHFITEIDSFSINHLCENMDRSTALLQKLPGGYSMYSYLEELELLNFLRDAKTNIEGVDLLHPASIRLILYELSKSPNLDNKSINKLDKLIESHSNDLTKGYLSSRTRKKTLQFLVKLKEKCPEYESSLIRYAIHTMYPNKMMNARAEYMISRMKKLVENKDFVKENVLFKFGASHTLKTENTAGHPDLGWYLNSLSKQQLVNTYFLTIVPVSGRTGLPFEINDSTSVDFDFNTTYYEPLKDLYHSVKQGKHSLFIDVDSFRKSLDGGTAISPELKIILDNYDGIIFIDKVTPSKPIKAKAKNTKTTLNAF